MPEPKKTDGGAPSALTMELKSADGKPWGTLVASKKTFQSGSVGFYANGKAVNPESGEKYQIGCNITLIGSKPDA